MEQVCEADPLSTLDRAERCITRLCDPVARVILACDLAQVHAKLGRDPYRLLEFAKSETVGVSIRAEIYIALVEGKLGYRTERKLRWAEECARIQSPAAWLEQTQAAVVRIQAKAGDWSAARCTIRRIDDPLQKLLSCCELAVSAHEQGNEWALETLPPLDNITRLCDAVRAKCILTMTGYSLGLDVSGQVQQLIDLARQVREPADRQLAAILILRVLSRCRKVGLALQMVNALPKDVRQEALLAMCQETSDIGHLADTQTLADHLMVPGYRDHALYCLVRCAACAATGWTPKNTSSI
jgi:hypothetical protein